MCEPACVGHPYCVAFLKGGGRSPIKSHMGLHHSFAKLLPHVYVGDGGGSYLCPTQDCVYEEHGIYSPDLVAQAQQKRTESALQV